MLVEFSYIGMPYNWHEMIFELIRRGYQPILAHPERYSFLNATQILEKMVLIILNTPLLVGLKIILNLNTKSLQLKI